MVNLNGRRSVPKRRPSFSITPPADALRAAIQREKPPRLYSGPSVDWTPRAGFVWPPLTSAALACAEIGETPGGPFKAKPGAES